MSKPKPKKTRADPSDLQLKQQNNPSKQVADQPTQVVTSTQSEVTKSVERSSTGPKETPKITGEVVLEGASGNRSGNAGVTEVEKLPNFPGPVGGQNGRAQVANQALMGTIAVSDGSAAQIIVGTYDKFTVDQNGLDDNGNPVYSTKWVGGSSPSSSTPMSKGFDEKKGSDKKSVVNVKNPFATGEITFQGAGSNEASKNGLNAEQVKDGLNAGPNFGFNENFKWTKEIE